MKANELREKTDEELRELERQLAEDVFRLRLQRGADELKDTGAVRQNRRDLARVKTIIRERAGAAAAESQRAGGENA